MAADWDEVHHLRWVQDGVVTRAQLREAGLTYADVQRLLRRKDLVRITPGVFIDHTGPPSWSQRAQAAVRACWPGALSHESVWRETPLIHLAIEHRRRIAAPSGAVVHRMRHLDARVNWLSSPPRVRIEEAVLDVAGSAPDDFAAAAALADVVQRRLTTYAAIEHALQRRSRTPRGVWLRQLLPDLGLGANSVLEHEYLWRVERPHGLPPSDRQLPGRAGDRRVERDVYYRGYGVIVELVGCAFHDDVRSWNLDLDRDLAAAVDEDALTVRLGWGQVLRDHCRTALRVGVLLQRGGWSDRPTRCRLCQ
jgi:hypothetical protein